MDLKTVAQNVRRMRLAKDMSQKNLAEASGVSVPAIKGLEMAKGETRTNTLVLVARGLGVTFRELLQPARALHAVRFRYDGKLRSRENILARVAAWLEDYLLLEKLVSDRRSLTMESAIHSTSLAAAMCRRKLKIRGGEPIHDICGLLEDAGVKVYPLCIDSAGFRSLSVAEKDGGPAIVVNASGRTTVEERIFAVARELGHLMLHPGSYNVAETAVNEEEERQATLFASYLLMPDKAFRREWNNASGLPQVERLLRVKRIFRVSYRTVLDRIVEYGAALDIERRNGYLRGYQRLFAQASRFNEEPERLRDPDFMVVRRAGLVRKALEKGKVSVGRGAELLGISHSDMHALMEEWGVW